MGGLADGRIAGWADRRIGRSTHSRNAGLKALAALVVLSAYPAIRLSAQVGHDPAQSPYHDVRRGSMVRVTTGYFGGSRGKVPVGPSEGPTGGLRFEYPVSNIFTFAAGLSYAQTEAFYLSPYDSNPIPHGPINNDLVLADVGLQATITGAKSFHGLQPYVGGALAIVFGSPIPADTSGYRFGTKLGVVPEAGVRWYPARRLSVEVGYRFVLYKLSYPLSYRPSLLPVTDKLTEWTAHPWATFGIGWTF